MRTAADTPDWTRVADYPDSTTTTHREWRWEFLRRRPDYREAWEKYQGKGRPSPVMLGGAHGVFYALTDDVDGTRLRFGVSVIYDPCCKLTDDLIWRAGVFHPVSGCGVTSHPDSALRLGAALASRPGSVDQEMQRLSDRIAAERDAGIQDYRFNIAEPLEPQLTKARNYLRRIQEERFGKINTRRPSCELWPLYLRVLDARDSGASWQRIGRILWPSDAGETKNKARRTYDSAVGVRDNFPI